MGKLRASDAAMTIYATPLAGVALAALPLGEALTAFTVAGAALIMADLYSTRARTGPRDRHGNETPEATDR